MANTFRMRDVIRNVDSNSLLANLSAWEDKVMGDIVKANPGQAAELMGLGHIPIYKLPYKDQVRAMGQFRKISGMDEALANMAGTGGTKADKIERIIAAMKTVKSDKNGTLLRFPTTGSSTLDQLFSGMSINYDETIRSTRSGLLNPLKSGIAGSHFGVGTSSLPRFNERRFNMPTSMEAGKTYTTFDIETASLMRNQIREVSYHSGTVAAGGKIDVGSMQAGKETLFRPRAFARGTMGLKNADGVTESVKLEEFMEQRHQLGLSKLPTTKMDADFANRMEPFLKQTLASDYIVGHNILNFDIPHVYSSLQGTKRYKEDDAFRTLVDSARSHSEKNAIDTLVLARNNPNLAGLEMAPELAKRGEGTLFSIENILLETDLGERIGNERLKGLLGDKGLHFGDVDDQITMHLFEHMNDLQVKGDALLPGNRKLILRSSAITPFTNISNPSEVTDRALAIMKEVNSGKINPLEHETLNTRRLGLGTEISTDINSDNLVYGNNVFNKAIAADGIPTDKGMTAIQDQLARRGMPWAGVGFEERSLGTALSNLTSTLAPNNDIISKLNTDAMIQHYEMFDPKKVAYTTYTGRPSLPASLLESAGMLESDDGHLLRLSTVEPTLASQVSRVNLVYDFQKGGADRLADYVDTLGKETNFGRIAEAFNIDITGMTEGQIAGLDEVDRFRSAVADDGLVDAIRNSGDRGISIGQLQPREAEGVIERLRQFHGRDRLTDDDMLSIKTPFMDIKGGNIRTTGAVFDRHLTSANRAAIPKNVKQAQKVDVGYRDLIKSSPFKSKIAQFDAKFGSEATTPMAKRVYEGYQAVRAHIPKAVGLAAVAAIGMHMYGRKKENDQYRDTLDPMPIETGGRRYMSADLLQQNMDMGINKSYQRYDPLATAYVVDNLNNNKINHTAMNYDKNNVLYGGVL